MKTEAEIRQTVRELKTIIVATKERYPDRLEEMMTLALTTAALQWVVGENDDLDKVLDQTRNFLLRNGKV